jgi:predicted transcriptional regulator
MNRTRRALDLLRSNPGMTQAEAARQVGLSSAAMSVAVRRQKETAGMRCKHCGSLLPYLKDALDKKKR